MYNEDIMERFLNPRFAGNLRGANGIGSAQDPNTNEMIKLYISVNEDAAICDAKFKAFGSPVVIAVADAMTQMIVGMTIDEAEELNVGRIVKMFDSIPEERLYAVILAMNALNDTIDDYDKRLKRLQKKLLKEGNITDVDIDINEEDNFTDFYDD